MAELSGYGYSKLHSFQEAKSLIGGLNKMEQGGIGWCGHREESN